MDSVSTVVKKTNTISPWPLPSIDIIRYTGILKLVSLYVASTRITSVYDENIAFIVLSWKTRLVNVSVSSVKTSTVEPTIINNTNQLILFYMKLQPFLIC